MDGDGFDAWDLQPSAGGPAARVGLDLNSQAPSAVEGFPRLGLYGAFLQGDNDELLLGRGRGSRLPPYRPPRAEAGDGWVPSPPPTRQLNFGSLSAAAGRGGANGGLSIGGSSSGAGGSIRQRTNLAAAATGRRSRGGGSGRRGSFPQVQRAPRSAIRGQASGYSAPFNNGDEEEEDDVEELASSLVEIMTSMTKN